jgi:ABC-type lipoprotein release transport system permease subunit
VNVLTRGRQAGGPGAEPASPGPVTGSSTRLRWRDVLGVAAAGLQMRRLRAALSAAGIAIGIAAMVAVVSISASSRADLLAELDRTGTNLLTVSPGETVFGEDAKLPSESAAMVGRIGPVQAVSSTATLNAAVYRNDRVPAGETGGVSVQAASTDLLATLQGRVRNGTFLNEATARYPAVVLGSVAAERMGIWRADGSTRVWLGDRWFTVVGILESFPLAPEIDRSALVGFPVAAAAFHHDGSPSTIYVRTTPEHVDAVRAVLGRTANPQNPEEVRVSRPSDALAARAAADDAFTALLVGLGGVALLVGGIGIANVMVISVLERRPEIGLRRALGATRGHIRLQLLSEALLLSALGGFVGVVSGSLVTAAYSQSRAWTTVVPPAALLGGVGMAMVVGMLAGLWPAMRAARMSPTEALRTA